MVDAPDRRPETADLISQATEEVKERQKRLAEIERVQATARPPRQRISLAALIVAVPFLAVLLLVGFTDRSLAELFETRPSGPVARAQAEKVLKGLVEEIESFRHDYQELPEGLVEIGIPARGDWTYSVLGQGHYSIQGTLYGQRVAFDSTRTPARTAKD